MRKQRVRRMRIAAVDTAANAVQFRGDDVSNGWIWKGAQRTTVRNLGSDVPTPDCFETSDHSFIFSSYRKLLSGCKFGMMTLYILGY